MGAAWILCNSQNNHHEIEYIQSLYWDYNTLIGAEALILLNFIKEVKTNTAHLKEGLIEVYNDNIELVKNIQNRVIKSSNGVKDGSTLICEIINMIQTMAIRVYVDYTNGRTKKKKKRYIWNKFWSILNERL